MAVDYVHKETPTMTLNISQKPDPILRKTLTSINAKPYQQDFSLPGMFYTDPLWMQAECEELFARDWVCVGRVEELSKRGDYFCFDHIGEPVLLVHGQDGVIRAMSNVCRHRATVIASGSGNTRKFMCPYHHWAYDTSGQLLNAPMFESSPRFDLEKCRLPQLKLEIWQGFIFISLLANPKPLAKQLLPLQKWIKNYHLEEMSLRYLADEVWEVNWKCLRENFMEEYHLTPLHKDTLHKVNPTHLCLHLTPGKLHFSYQVGFATRVSDQHIGHADLSEDEHNTCVMFAIPPGLTVGIGSDYSSFLCMRLATATSVRVKMGLIFHGDSWSEQSVKSAVEPFKHTMDEDKEVQLRVQQGLASRFHQPGPLAAQDMEGTIWDFYQYLSNNKGSVKKSAIKSTS
ncbi:MAG: phenylpropionate dioxygenase-like ring-hydroxylating dioxygenase large terminal subunit [Planctomycetota bacterium]|jgi:phenylpropionate dioxygenase-like ring-hydroxylating dioxygenase large terminal subunit